MVTIIIVSVLAATVGVLFSRLLTLHESEREEAYIKEKLADICATYADFLSLGTNVILSTPSQFEVTYRHETGGVSFETGRVSRVERLTTVNELNVKGADTMNLDIRTFEQGKPTSKSGFSRILRGDDVPLINPIDMKELKINGDIDLSYDLHPFSSSPALWYLTVKANYDVTYDKGKHQKKTVMAGRIVRLWNRE